MCFLEIIGSFNSSKSLETGLLNNRKARVHHPTKGRVSELPKTWTTMKTLDEQSGRLPADGALYCCACFKETTLVHKKGRHPFDKLKCFNCSHICCSKCYTTDILAKKNLGGDQVSVSRSDEKEVPYLTVCPQCGLTHRARRFLDGRTPGFMSLVFNNRICRCGLISSSEWLRLAIGAPNDWRADPDECYMKAVLHRAETSITPVPKSARRLSGMFKDRFPRL